MPKKSPAPGTDEELPFKFDGKWFPECWGAYVTFVLEDTHLTDNYRHLFLSSGKDLDKSSAKSRKQERKQQLDEKAVKRQAVPGARGITIDQMQFQSFQHTKLSMSDDLKTQTMINNMQKQIESFQRQNDSDIKLLQLMHPNNPTKMKDDVMFKQIMSHNNKIAEILQNIETKQWEMSNSVSYHRSEAERLLNQVSTNFGSPPPVNSVVGTNLRSSPVSQMMMPGDDVDITMNKSATANGDEDNDDATANDMN